MYNRKLAYGQNYLAGKGDMFLIYPKHSKFDNYLSPFSFNEKLKLWVVPFDLNNDRLLLPDQFLKSFFSTGDSELMIA